MQNLAVAEKKSETKFEACAHCGSKVEPPLSRFCCNGCEQVFNLLQDQQLTGYYRLLQQDPPLCPLPARISSDSFKALDDENLIQSALVAPETVEFYVDGLNCSACLWLLEKLPQLCSDVVESKVNMSRSVVRVTRQPGTSFAAAASALNRLGYKPVLIKNNDDQEKLATAERRRELVRIGIAAAATGNIMLLAVAMYAGADGSFLSWFRWVTAALSVPVLTYCSMPFYKQAWAAIRTRSINIDLPIVAAIVVGGLVSIQGLITGAETLYLDSVSMLVFLLLSSRFLLATIQRHFLNTSHLEDELFTGTFSRVLPSGAIELVSSESLREGDIVKFDSEGHIPVDGEVIEGSGFIEAAALTGEAKPIFVQKNSRIEAGSKHVLGVWFVRVEKAPSDTRLAQILKSAEALSKVKPKSVQIADRVGQIFVAVIFILALATFLYFASSNPAEGIARAMALIIVTCPCVFGMAIPLSMALAVRSAARQGIIIKDADVIDRLNAAKQIFFDKTGTLTTGDLAVSSAKDLSKNNEGFKAAYALEKNQLHPVARAIKNNLSQFANVTAAQNVVALSEGGVAGEFGGQLYMIIPLGQRREDQGAEIHSCFGVYRDRQLLATFDLTDEIRTEAKTTVGAFQKAGIQTYLLSGDRNDIVQSCAKRLGVEVRNVFAEASPERKTSLLENTKNAVMVGDGANDAAALAAASVGVAIHGSLDVSLRAADVYLVRKNLSALQDLFFIAKSTRAAVLRNLFFSASFNAVSGTLAIAGLMQPLWAAVLMPLSSTIVLLSALAANKKGVTR